MQSTDTIAEGFVIIDGVSMYRIPDYDSMPPFFMSLTSDTDLWLYTSSTGGLTAGRVDEEHGLFLYDTVDRLHLAGGITGSKTYFRVVNDNNITLWEPFTAHNMGQLTRNIYKNVNGNYIIFEEIHNELQLTFRYSWRNSDEFGFTRKSTLINNGSSPVNISMIDGLLNIIPASTGIYHQKNMSCIIDAYTRCETDTTTSLGIIALSALIMDSPKPFESLMANTVWHTGLDNAKILLTTDQLSRFFNGEKINAETELKGRRGAYLVYKNFTVNSSETKNWYINADVEKSQTAVEELRALITRQKDMVNIIENAVANADINLTRLISASDGAQITGDVVASSHHGVNVLFNIMRGGIFADDYIIPVDDFKLFLQKKNKATIKNHADFLAGLPEKITHAELLIQAKNNNDPNLSRLCNEYLPLTFGRRHGDPSRPWNRFTVKVKNSDGSRVLNYQGNWRDIFQNWEALSLSYPEYLEGMISRFVNISTIDGFNPYRVSRDGFDWETVEPDDPWSNIGYWGDHQIIYLLKLLETSNKFYPQKLKEMLASPVFTYSNVPYRLHKYTDIIKDPKTTIDYDHAEVKNINDRIAGLGEDGKLIFVKDKIYHVNLAEKLLVPALSKLSNLVVDGGIWMNTQRPEWNDGNNALVGYGLSMVTLCYLRRYIAFCQKLFSDDKNDLTLSAEVKAWMEKIDSILLNNKPTISTTTISDEKRKNILDELGSAFEEYREKVYKSGFSGKENISAEKLSNFFTIILAYLDHSIHANRRDDGMYHSYNLLDINGDKAVINRLYEMLEGQVAVLSSGVLSSFETITVLDSLFASDIYREDQNSFMLYPARKLPGFLQRNVIPAEEMAAMPSLAENNSIIIKDAAGNYRFAASLCNNDKLQSMLDEISKENPTVKNNRDEITALYEKVFNHHAFTGRSGTMYGYEGLGCIYWHMAAKLLLAVQEIYLQSIANKESADISQKLHNYYYRVRGGLGFNKTAKQYGAFPIDPYSHTPGHSGAQQPGMTGQVKEEIITRWGELGILINNGAITFNPSLLRDNEYLTEDIAWKYCDTTRQQKTLHLLAGTLAFTISSVPVIYHKDKRTAEIKIIMNDSTSAKIAGNTIPPVISTEIFGRTGNVNRIEVCFK